MKTVALAEISQLIDYGVTASANFAPVGPKFLRITDIQNGTVDWESVPYCEAKDRKLTASRLRNGDIVFARTGATTGKSFLIQHCPENAVFASYLIRLRPSPAVDPIFLSQFFNSADYWAQISKSSVGAAQPGVNASKLQELRVPLPPLSEQRRDPAILDQADALRAKRRAALAQLDDMAQAIFVEMFGDPETNPRKWPIRQLSELVVVGDRINYGVVQPGEDCEEGVPLVRVSDISEGRVDHRALKRISPTIESQYRRSRLQGDEILISCVGSIGLIALTSLREKGFNVARAVARVRVNDTVKRQFIGTYLATNYVKSYFESELRTVSQPTLNIKQIGETPIIVPSFVDQEMFCNRLDAVDRLRLQAIASNNHLSALFSSLQHRAFTGAL